MGLFVALAGNIGAGKTTAAHLIADAFDMLRLHEPVVDNRFLASYYEDMGRWSFTLQMEFLLRRIEHHRQVDMGAAAGYVQDRTLLEDPEIFAKYLHGLGHMTDEELELYFDFCRLLLPSVRHPDRVILLACENVNTLLRRISERGRAAESTIGANFLRGLGAYYSTFADVCTQKYAIPTLVIDVASLDIRTKEGRKAFLERVEPFLFQTPEEYTGSGRLF